jgi:rare lipoprotein A
MYGNTAAHKTLPFNTKLLVCYEGCAVVRVNDRGPYIGTRELDLSYGAAEQIGLLWPGVAYTMVTPI